MKDHPTTNNLKEITFSREFTAGNQCSFAMNFGWDGLRYFIVALPEPSYNYFATSKHNHFSCNLKTSLFMYLIILQCGDIEIQPGLERYPCGVCSKRVT